MGKVEEINTFLDRSTIHGLSYLGKNETRCSRVIWTLIVLTASGVAGYLLFNTVKGFDEHYTSTTLETRGILEYPFPAVTFYPGDYNSGKVIFNINLNSQFTKCKNIIILNDLIVSLFFH